MLLLNYLFSNSASNLILDEPDNFLDIANKDRLKSYLGNPQRPSCSSLMTGT